MRYAWVFCVLLIGCAGRSGSQLEVRSFSEGQSSSAVHEYDSTRNYLGADVEQYLGQTLHVRGLSGRARPYGYAGFYARVPENAGDLSSVYARNADRARPSSPYDALAGRSFVVTDIVKSARAAEPTHLRDITYLQLTDTEGREILFYEYDPAHAERFPFVVQGYVEKLESRHAGKRYIVRRLDSLNALGSLNRAIRSGDTLTCTGIFLEDSLYTLVAGLERTDGAELIVSPKRLSDLNRFYPLAHARTLTERFGDETAGRIVRGDLSPGMSKEACTAAWGTPENVNRLVDKDGDMEQWVYGDGRYLYFRGDSLTSVQIGRQLDD
ncbi:MAG: hypothetical protein GF331_03405 [Chitinivibrionales bacterium]|nr:hypothetical protein [Chitinivibrionales bacterium]